MKRVRLFIQVSGIIVFLLLMSACSSRDEDISGGDGSLNVISTASVTQNGFEMNLKMGNLDSNNTSTRAEVTLLKESDGSPIAAATIEFALSDPNGANSGLVEFANQSNGFALTNSDGKATITVTIPDGSTATGLARVAAIYTLGTDASTTIRTQIDFQVTADPSATGESLVLGNSQGGSFNQGVLQLTTNPISFAGSTSVIATVVDSSAGNIPTSELITVDFTSTCVRSGSATIDEQKTTIDGVATAQYTATTCTTSDTITASATLNGVVQEANASLLISPDTAGSIQFVSADPNSISIKGTGGSDLRETSTVQFRVLGSTGQAVSNQSVTFSLSTTVGGVRLEGADSEGKLVVTTNGSGIVNVVVRSGTVPTSVVVRAQLTNDSSVSTESSNLVISTGLPDQDSFSLSAAQLNPEAFNFDGVEVQITARLADSINNPVPDGTAVSFNTEGGVIQPSCSTVAGVCSVNWTSQDPRPADHRTTILATVIGVESFVDANGNNLFSDGESFDDRAEPFRDENENSSYDIGEFFFDFNNDGTHTAANSSYNGVACDPANQGPCSDSTTAIGESIVLVMASSSNTITQVSGVPISSAAEGVQIATFDVSDTAGNIPAVGTTINSSVIGTGATSAFSVTVPNTNSNAPMTVSIPVEITTANANAQLEITVTSPSGLVTTASFPIQP